MSRKRRPRKRRPRIRENNDLENNDLENDDLENDDLENNDLENDDLKKTAGSRGHSGANLNAERKLPDDNFRKFAYILRKCCSIRYCMEVAENLNQTF